jgi:hypothetical protein
MNKIPTALKLGHRKGFVALDPEGVKAIAQGNALCHSEFLPPSPERAQANNIITGFRPFRAFGGNCMRHRALPCAIALTPSGSPNLPTIRRARPVFTFQSLFQL